jgi:hypothetical protein
VTATTSGGASATQSWTVTPTGTIRATWVDYLSGQDGPTAVPYDWNNFPLPITAQVPQPDGSLQTFTGTDVNGVMQIPNVPAGYYWLRISNVANYWTSTSTFDMGGNYQKRASSGSNSSPTSFAFSFTSLESSGNGWLQVLMPELWPLPVDGSTSPGSSTWTDGMVVGGLIDYSTVKTAVALQYEPATLGSLSGFVLGPELSFSNLSLVGGTVNNIGGGLNPPVRTSIDLAISGSQWANLFDHVSPTTPSVVGGVFAASVQPYVTSQVVAGGPNAKLIWSPVAGLGPADPRSFTRRAGDPRLTV